MAGLTLDAGALIAADRNDRRLWAFWAIALKHRTVAVVPAPALAQAWRGGRNARMAQFLEACDIESLDESLAKAAGELCGRTRTSDIVDAVVVVGAAVRGDHILTSDPGDLRRLAAAADGVRIVDLKDI